MDTSLDLPPLRVFAGCIAGRVVIENRENQPWIDVVIEVNREYKHRADAIPAGERYQFMPQIFTKGDGTRLDFSRVACETMDVHATVANQRRHWNGAY